MTDNTLRTLGLALRGRNLAVGEAPVEEACRGHKAKVVLLAQDAAENTAGKAHRLAEQCGASLVVLPFGKAEIGYALGRSVCAVAAVTNAGLAASLLKNICGVGAQSAPGQKPQETTDETEHRRWPV